MKAIMAVFTEWEHLLKSIKDQIEVFSDLKILKEINSTKILN
jgi:hypothetical protein